MTERPMTPAEAIAEVGDNPTILQLAKAAKQRLSGTQENWREWPLFYCDDILTEIIRRLESGDNAEARAAFVKGAQWWEYHETKATMWASDRALAEAEAERRWPDAEARR